MSSFDGNDNNVEAQVRRALNAEADMVNPAGDGLGRIRAAVDEQRGRAWWRSPAVALTAAAVTGLAVAGATIALSVRDGDQGMVADQPTANATAATTPSATATPTPTAPSQSPSATQAPAQRVALPIYYVHDDGSGIRLYREFHTVPLVDGDRIRTALLTMFMTDAKDPDYTSPWPKDTRVNRVTTSADTATIDLSQAATRAKLRPPWAQATLQQLVHTVTAADTSIEKVRLTVEGRDIPELFGNVPVGTRAIERAPALDVQGLIWLLSPEQGEKVGRTLRIEGYGTAFEGTVAWELRNAAGDIFDKGFTQAGANGEFAEFSAETTLPGPGTYTISVFERSAEDGRRVHVDDKTFTSE